MRIGFRQRRGTLCALALAAAACWCVVARPTAAQAPDTRSIVGSTPLYGLTGATGWINSPPLGAKDLKGKVVLVDFWAYSCINCLRSMPYVEAWAEKYRDAGLVVIGVHTPEFDFEKQQANVEKAVKKFGITFPVALDSNHAVWNAFHNEYWPADYFIDARGKVQYEQFGEGDYAQSERWIQKLLKETSATPAPAVAALVRGQGIAAPSDENDMRSPETYIGGDRGKNFASPGGVKLNREKTYTVPSRLWLNEWGLDGDWIEHEQFAELKAAGGKIVYRFHARDLHLVLGPTAGGKPVRFKVTIDGQAPGANHGVDIDAEGNGVVTDYRLYQLVRLGGKVADHTFTIEFEDAGVQAYSFTFG